MKIMILMEWKQFLVFITNVQWEQDYIVMELGTPHLYSLYFQLICSFVDYSYSGMSKWTGNSI